jgi:periplasmic protein CpxP/Spy
MNTLPSLKPLILIASLALGAPFGALADSAPGMPAEHGMDGAPHGHEMGGCMRGGPDGGMHHGMAMFAEGGPLPPMLRHLQLSEAQQDKIFAILHAQAPQARDMGKALHKAHRALHELTTAASFDDAKAKAAADALGKAVADEALLHARTHRQIFDVLTPEQRQKLAKMGEHGRDGGHGDGHHGDHPPMPN